MSSGPALWRQALDAAERRLIAERGDRPYWLGQLADSALATATAVSALHLADPVTHAVRVDRALGWLAADRNTDGGWGDSPASPSNPSCTALVLGAQRICGRPIDTAGEAYLDETGGMAAIPARYGADRTFSAPILTHAALAGLVAWSDVPPLPMELAALPRWTFRLGPMPVVSYALPALIAIGLVGRVKRPPCNLLLRWLSQAVTSRILKRLESIQPASGGFLEAAPLTAFVAMSLIAAGWADHAVARRAVAFLLASQRDSGAWAIDENLSVWNTTMAVNALGRGDGATLAWLLDQQSLRRHPYTNSPPGGWGWSHLPGAVPDADDTAGALLALGYLAAGHASPPAAPYAGGGHTTHEARQAAPLQGRGPAVERAVLAGIKWLLGLQNRDGGWPTFCRGWGKLEFDRSAADLTAHALRALHRWEGDVGPALARRIARARTAGLQFLAATQRGDGTWLPLWFGSQHTADQTNPILGTSRVLAAYRDLGLSNTEPGRAGRAYLASAADGRGGWGAASGCPPTIEETAVVLEALADTEDPNADTPVRSGADWLAQRILAGGLDAPSPIGLYFAKLWYHERMYPISLSVAAFRRVLATAGVL